MMASRDWIERLGDRASRLRFIRPRNSETLPIQLDRRRIYVLPTGFGWFFFIVLLVMVAGALNYNNNPALMLTFLLCAVAHNSLVQSHMALSGVQLMAIHAEPVFAGQPMTVIMHFSDQPIRDRRGLELLGVGQTINFAVQQGEPIDVAIDIATAQRGKLTLPRMRLSTIRPFGMARAWSWLLPDTELLVYPPLEANAPPLPQLPSAGSDQRQVQQHGEAPHHLREYRPGDPPRHIAWKASARAENLLVREYEAGKPQEVILDWAQMHDLRYEQRISRLARWVVEAERSGVRYTVKMPRQTLGPGRGSEHRNQCLRELALLPDLSVR